MNYLLEDYKDGTLEWVTKNGEHFLVQDITNNHLSKIKPFLISRINEKGKSVDKVEYLKLWFEIIDIEHKKRFRKLKLERLLK